MITFRSAARDNNATNNVTSQVSVGLPAGTIDGDFLLAAVGIVGGATISVTAPSGWTLLRRTDQGTVYGLAIYYRFAQGEPVRWAWTFSGSATHSAVVRSYTGVDGFFPVDAETSQQNASSTTQPTPSVTTSVTASLLVTTVAANGNIAFTAPTGYTSRINKLQANVSLEGEDTPISSSGATASANVTLSGARLGITHALALRPSVGTTVTVEQARTALKALFPPGDDLLYDWDNSTDPSNLWLLTQAIAQFCKAYGYDYVDLLRQEVSPLAVVATLSEWEGALGITQSSASAANQWIATRQTAILSKLRESGATTLAAIRAVLEPLLGYSGANAGTLVVMETSRAALTALHTYPNFSGGSPGGSTNTTQGIVIASDGGPISKAGIQIAIAGVTSTNPEQLSFTLVGPAGTPSAPSQVNITWPAGTLPPGNASSTTFYLYDTAISPGCQLAGLWFFTITTGAVGCSFTSWSIFTEGVGTGQATGGAAFEWGVYADPAKVSQPDYVGVLRAISRIQPGYSHGTLVLTLSPLPDVATGVNAAIPDECVPV